ncbi:MAG TPA: C45 family autoproteolytic acyltransferase/hydrolase [Pirellulales bacterium]|nr:C45 family autoproteolytic acyltransferase/hydrolase [Pirellulales bacterium]
MLIVRSAILLAAIVSTLGARSLIAAEASLPVASDITERKPLASASSFRPDPATIVRYGAGYRYPQAGWIVLHVEGAPYERGYQHGRLMAAEIVEFIKTRAKCRSPKASTEAWRDVRTLVNALFLRRYDAEYLEEMKGIADGAAAVGAKYDDRPVDLIDIVTLNSDMEMSYLTPGVHATATGLDDETYHQPISTERPHAAEEHCSAFAATAPATADGEIIFGHITMCGLADAHQYNVWLDIAPKAGHRIVMQSYPGGIMSGLDYYINSAGILVLETTIRQTDFDITGQVLASRIRQAVQYAGTIDQAIKILSTANNGLYSNEWMLADINTGEIAMFELGTHKSKLWRSSRHEWPGDTRGFYWGCNNAKDMEVRKESLPTLGGKPGNVVLHPTDRDRTWLRLFREKQGKLTADFGFEAFTTAPLAAFPSCDAKFTTTKLAKELKSWALFGPPLGRAWMPTEDDREHCPGLQPLVSNDWTLISVDAAGEAPAEAPKLADAELFPEEKEDRFDKPVSLSAAWRGTLLPKSDADTWLAAGHAGFERVVALERALEAAAKGEVLDRAARDHLDVALFTRRSQWLTGVARSGHDVPLADTRFDWETDHWYHMAAGKGVLLLAALRQEIGPETFDRLMDGFGTAHAGQEVSTDEFRVAAEKACGRSLDAFFHPWLKGAPNVGDVSHGVWSIVSFEEEPEQTLIVYGTLGDRAAQREAADLLARKVARRWSNVLIAAQSDVEVSDADLKNHHLLLIGRPATNAVTAKFAAALPVKFDVGSFQLRGETYGDARSAVIAAGSNPYNARYSVVVYAGLGGDATTRAITSLPDEDSYSAEVLLYPARKHSRRLCITPVLPSAEAAAKAAAK